MFTYGGNFSGTNSGYAGVHNGLDSGSYPSGATSGGSSTHDGQPGTIGLDNTVVDSSAAAIENWWLKPSSDGDFDQYPGSTVLGAPWNGFTNPSDFQAGLGPGDNTFETNDVDRLDAHRKRVIQPAPSLPPATIASPTIIPSPDRTLPLNRSLLPTAPSVATGTDDQPLTVPDTDGQWPYPNSVGKGKARATDRFSPTNPSASSNTTWQYQQPRTPRHYCAGPGPYMNTGVPNSDLSATVASSSGPHRSKRGANHKGSETEKGTGRRKRAPKWALPPDVDWDRTCDRFYWEIIQTYLLQPSGGLTTPEVAYAKNSKFIREDLHQSPLMVKELGVRPSREQEQYLTGVLEVLYPARKGEKRDAQRLLDQVADEIERGLFMVNDAVALRDGPSNETKPEKLDGSAKGVQHRKVERERRDASHETLRRMSFFFKALPKSLSRNQVLFFAITYLVFGVEGFGDSGFVIALPKP